MVEEGKRFTYVSLIATAHNLEFQLQKVADKFFPLQSFPIKHIPLSLFLLRSLFSFFLQITTRQADTPDCRRLPHYRYLCAAGCLVDSRRRIIIAAQCRLSARQDYVTPSTLTDIHKRKSDCIMSYYLIKIIFPTYDYSL